MTLSDTTDQPDAYALRYRPSRAGLDTGAYNLGAAHLFSSDPVTHSSISDLAHLAASPHWEDRIRAELLRRQIHITLPDQFPCIYEPPESPSNVDARWPSPTAWVVSPDIDMLDKLLPDYQELWDSYTSQWGPRRRRLFTVGRLDGLTPNQVYRPGATGEQIIGSTMLTHPDMYGRAPKRLQRMHPQHAQLLESRHQATA